MTEAGEARADWEERIGQRSGVAFGGNAPRLDPPKDLETVPGAHQVTLTWSPVVGAIGYQVYAAPDAEGPWQPVDHAGRDVLAVPHPPYADTTGTPGGLRWYAVTSLSDVHVEVSAAIRSPRRRRPDRPPVSPSRSTSPTRGVRCRGRGAR